MRLRFQCSKSTDNTKIYVSTAARQHLEGLDGPFLTHPEQTSDADVNLVDQRQILVAFGVLDFIDADGVDLAKRSGCVSVAPGNVFDDHRATASAIDAPHRIQQEYEEFPQRDELEAAFGELIITGCRMMTTRTDGRRTLAGPY